MDVMELAGKVWTGLDLSAIGLSAVDQTVENQARERIEGFLEDNKDAVMTLVESNRFIELLYAILRATPASARVFVGNTLASVIDKHKGIPPGARHVLALGVRAVVQATSAFMSNEKNTDSVLERRLRSAWTRKADPLISVERFATGEHPTHVIHLLVDRPPTCGAPANQLVKPLSEIDVLAMARLRAFCPFCFPDRQVVVVVKTEDEGEKKALASTDAKEQTFFSRLSPEKKKTAIALRAALDWYTRNDEPAGAAPTDVRAVAIDGLAFHALEAFDKLAKDQPAQLEESLPEELPDRNSPEFRVRLGEFAQELMFHHPTPSWTAWVFDRADAMVQTGDGGHRSVMSVARDPQLRSNVVRRMPWGVRWGMYGVMGFGAFVALLALVALLLPIPLLLGGWSSLVWSLWSMSPMAVHGLQMFTPEESWTYVFLAGRGVVALILARLFLRLCDDVWAVVTGFSPSRLGASSMEFLARITQFEMLKSLASKEGASSEKNPGAIGRFLRIGLTSELVGLAVFLLLAGVDVMAHGLSVMKFAFIFGAVLVLIVELMLFIGVRVPESTKVDVATANWKTLGGPVLLGVLALVAMMGVGYYGVSHFLGRSASVSYACEITFEQFDALGCIQNMDGDPRCRTCEIVK